MGSRHDEAHDHTDLGFPDHKRLAWFYLFGRLEPGVTIGTAQAAMKMLYRQRQRKN